MMRSPNLILVEGIDDVHVVLHLLYRHGFARGQPVEPERFVFIPEADGGSGAIHIKDKQGYDSLLRDLRVELTPTDLRRLAIIVDADTDIAARWRSLRDGLRQGGYTNVPEAPEADGTVLTEHGMPVAAVWVMPDNQRHGYLEHFVAGMVASRDTLWPRAQECVERIPADERRFATVHRDKAKVHTWLAWQEDPGRRMGEALRLRYLDANCEAALRFVGWVRRWLGTQPTAG